MASDDATTITLEYADAIGDIDAEISLTGTDDDALAEAVANLSAEAVEMFDAVTDDRGVYGRFRGHLHALELSADRAAKCIDSGRLPGVAAALESVARTAMDLRMAVNPDHLEADDAAEP